MTFQISSVYSWIVRSLENLPIFAVFKMEVTFHLAARLSDECEVVTRLIPGSPYRMKMAQQLMRGDELLTEALVDVVCLDSDFELREFPEVLLEDLD